MQMFMFVEQAGKQQADSRSLMIFARAVNCDP
jgi:hypothetical protein